MKVVDEFGEELEGYEEQLVDRSTLKPDLVVCVNPLENYVLLHECGLNNIPTIGIIDTDADPTWVTYPIPANDDRYAPPPLSLPPQANECTQSSLCQPHRRCPWQSGRGGTKEATRSTVTKAIHRLIIKR